MKKTELFKNIYLKNVALLLTVIAFLLTACSQKMNFTASPVVPAAEGSVKLKKDKNDNYVIDVNIIRLAEPDRLQPPKETYVVWMRTKSNGTKNIGQLQSSSGLLSKTLKASLNTVTPFEPESFFITAENDGAAVYPGSEIVLETK